MKKWLTKGLVILLSAILVGLAVNIYVNFRNGKVNKVTVHIENNNQNKGFLIDSTILRLVHSNDSIIGKPVKLINIKKIETKIRTNPYVLSTDAFFTLSGNLIINVKERTPLFRIENSKATDCYVDNNGKLFPLSENYVARVMLVNGYINSKLKMGSNIQDTTYSKTLLPGILMLAKQISTDPFLKAAISQIFVNSKKELDLIPEVGNQVIRFGKPDHISDKLENLKAFYEQIMVNGGFNKYKEINLKYTNQVVCTK